MNFVICSQHRLEKAARAKPLVMPDDRIEFYADLYRANPLLAQLGITFEMFLLQPGAILPAATFNALVPLTDFFDKLTLLPKQRVVQERLDAADAGQLAFDLNDEGKTA